MTRVNLLLLALVVVCAIGVVTSQHRARRLFSAIEAEQVAAKKLEDEYSQLQVEQGTWATHRRIESVAARQLGMRVPEPGTTILVPVGPPQVAEAKP